MYFPRKYYMACHIDFVAGSVIEQSFVVVVGFLLCCPLAVVAQVLQLSNAYQVF